MSKRRGSDNRVDFDEVQERLRRFEDRYGVATDDLERAFTDFDGTFHEHEDYMEWSALRRIRTKMLVARFRREREQ